MTAPESPQPGRSTRGPDEARGANGSGPGTHGPRAARAIASLGEGDAEDRLGFREVLAILLRCLPLLRGVRRELVGVVLASSLLGLAMISAGYLLLPVLWESVLQAEVPSGLHASVFGVDLEAVGDGPLEPDLRRRLGLQVIVVSLLAIPLLMGLGMGLWYWIVMILQRVNQTLRMDLVERLQSLSLRFHHESRIGDAIYRMYQDSAGVTQLINVLLLTPLNTLTQYTVVVIAVAAFDWRASLLLLGLWLPMLGLGRLFSRRLRVRFRRAREANSDLTSQIQESLSGIRVLKAYGLEDREQRLFERASREAFATANRARTTLAQFGVWVFWALGAGLLAAILWTTLSTRDGVPLQLATWLDDTDLGRSLTTAGFSIWTLGLYNLFKGLFGAGAGGVNNLLRTWGRTQDVVIGLDRVFEILEIEPEVSDAPDARPLEGLSHAIEFDSVSFSYRPGRPVLRDLSLRAPAGTITALVGPTGSGKSTVMALLLRLFDPDRGSIRIDGQDLRELTLASLRQHVSIALQENLLFGASVRENIAYAAPGASDAQVREAARIACADEFISALPAGYATQLGERGTKLSTGQRQRITIARAILKDAPVLILDEPTAALDAATEQALVRNLAEWGRDRCVFLITHRLSTIRMADQIVFLRDGQIVESASHDELMALDDGAYRRLVETERRSVEASA